MTVHLVGPKDRVQKDKALVNVTSQSPNWGRELSPFLVGPIELYHMHKSKNMENAWQYTKVYPEHVNKDGEVTPRYWGWAEKGWKSERANRYPMGMGRKPLFSLWDEDRYTYVEARRRIYVPLYARAVMRTKAFETLNRIYETLGEVYLWDFDVYDHRKMGKSYMDVIMDENRKCGHGFVLAMMLELGEEGLWATLRGDDLDTVGAKS